MEIAIGIVFLALFVGAIFLFFLIIGLFIWRRAKRQNENRSHGFVSESKSRSGNDLHDSDDNNYDNAAYFAAASYANSSSQENREASAGTIFNDSNSDKEVSAGMSYEGATEGGDYASSGNDSASSYDSGSSSDSSSSSDSGSSSSSSSD